MAGEGSRPPHIFIMKVAHFSIFAPNRCGLYHTAKELVLSERLVGIDARMIGLDHENHKPIEVSKDGDFETVEPSWGVHADILVRHSVIPMNYQLIGIPIVLAIHGRPESSYRLELVEPEKSPILSIFNSKTKDQRHKAFVCFWKEYMDIWSYLVPKHKLFYAPAPISLKEYNPVDIEPFPLKSYSGSPNILIADMWRQDIVPFNILFGAAKFAKKFPKARVHIVGVPDECIKAMRPFFENLRYSNILGIVHGQTQKIKSVYKACDVVLTPHIIATRIIRESLSMNKPVIAGTGCKYTPYTANYLDIDDIASQIENWWRSDKKYQPRKEAEKLFSMKETGLAMKHVFDTILPRKSKRRKVFLDIGGHIGESIRKFYREVVDADEYEIYTFEPDPSSYQLLDKMFYEMKNLVIENACLGKEAGMVDFYRGKVNYGEGGTLVRNKVTGKIDYSKPIKVECINIAEWVRNNINEGDYFIVKMNIEGGEYDLMEILLDEDLTGHIDKCFISLHAHKFPVGQQRQRYHQIESRFFNEGKCIKYMSNKETYSFE